jgi:hypothetical protein
MKSNNQDTGENTQLRAAGILDVDIKTEIESLLVFESFLKALTTNTEVTLGILKDVGFSDLDLLVKVVIEEIPEQFKFLKDILTPLAADPLRPHGAIDQMVATLLIKALESGNSLITQAIDNKINQLDPNNQYPHKGSTEYTILPEPEGKRFSDDGYNMESKSKVISLCVTTQFLTILHSNLNLFGGAMNKELFQHFDKVLSDITKNNPGIAGWIEAFKKPLESQLSLELSTQVDNGTKQLFSAIIHKITDELDSIDPIKQIRHKLAADGWYNQAYVETKTKLQPLLLALIPETLDQDFSSDNNDSNTKDLGATGFDNTHHDGNVDLVGDNNTDS